jgi:transcriptional regulator with XRE-family HTH domain
MVAIRLRDLRVARNLTQEEVAERAGVKQSQVSAWEGGRRRPTLDNVRGLARAFRMPDADLARELGYLDPTNGGEDGVASGELPPAILALMHELIRQHPELAAQLEASRDDDDFPAQVRGLAKVLGIVARGMMEEDES